MKTLEKILGIIAILSVIMIFLTIPWGYAIMFFSMGVLSWLYWPLGFAFLNDIRLRNIFKKESYSKKGMDVIMPAFLTGLAIAQLCTGILFWFSRYPYAEIMLFAGFGFSIVSWLVIAVIASQNTIQPYKRMIIRLLIFNIISLVIYFTPMYILEQRIDPFSFDQYEELICENESANNQLIPLVIEMNSMLDEETEIKGIEVEGQYLLIYFELGYYRISPEHAGLFYRRKTENEAAKIVFRKRPGKSRLEMYFLNFPEKPQWKEQTWELDLPKDRQDEFVRSVAWIFCKLGEQNQPEPANFVR